MGLGVVADLVAHAGREDEFAAVFEGRFQLALHAEKNMSFLAPMVGEIAGRIVDHADPDWVLLVAEKPCAPIGHAGFSLVLGLFDIRPVGRAERKGIHLHMARSCLLARCWRGYSVAMMRACVYPAALARACGRYCVAGCGAVSRARPAPNSFSRRVPLLYAAL